MIQHDDLDTDTLLAILASLLGNESTASHAEMLEALALHNGDVQAAVQALAGSRGSQSFRGDCSTTHTNQKRKRNGKMDDWLEPLRSAKGKKENSDEGWPRKIRVKGDNSPSLASTSELNSPVKPVVDLMKILRQAPPISTSTNQRTPAITLSTPALVAQHTPCTLHASVLPAELACRLFHVMLDKSRAWDRNRWYLFDRLVESPHRTSFFARRTNGVDDDEEWQQQATFWYNGRQTETPEPFPGPMEEACAYVEAVVDQELRKRKRFPLEWDGETPNGGLWKANVAASNMYEGAKEAVGFHTDALTYLGPYPTIASISLGISRIFRLREVVPVDEAGKRQPRTYNIPLPHNSLLIMHASTQERFKHTIPPQPTIDLFRPTFPHPARPDEPPAPSNCRINITFRFYRPDFSAKMTPLCRCGVPAILRPDMKMRSKLEGTVKLPSSSADSAGERGSEEEEAYRYWWACNAGAQNEGKSCGFWKVMDMNAEGRGPCLRDRDKEERKSDTT